MRWTKANSISWTELVAEIEFRRRTDDQKLRHVSCKGLREKRADVAAVLKKQFG
ncbi:hypothetical protein GCM10007874_50520 [Labrys miyagiensis]|uniref:DNA ligase (ATP) n=1 Tax=Labrys miyagiensis TaxID=346912 RepID=A0ABQ6CQC8_9HYPH|nr:hypothetical protein GCM10007874_50520 [Labrys miyagiensis]